MLNTWTVYYLMQLTDTPTSSPDTITLKDGSNLCRSSSDLPACPCPRVTWLTHPWWLIHLCMGDTLMQTGFSPLCSHRPRTYVTLSLSWTLWGQTFYLCSSWKQDLNAVYSALYKALKYLWSATFQYTHATLITENKWLHTRRAEIPNCCWNKPFLRKPDELGQSLSLELIKHQPSPREENNDSNKPRSLLRLCRSQVTQWSNCFHYSYANKRDNFFLFNLF